MLSDIFVLSGDLREGREGIASISWICVVPEFNRFGHDRHQRGMSHALPAFDLPIRLNE